MTGPLGVEARQRDPFAVPSGTTLRFALLVLSATVVVMTSTAQQLGPRLTSDATRRALVEYRACWERENREMDSLPASGAQSIAEVCGADPRVIGLWVPVTAVLVFWLLVFTVYWFLPAWRLRRRGYVPLGAELPEAAQALAALRERAGTEPVSWYAQPLDPRVSALAFGRWRRRCIVLSGGLLALRTTRPETFEAVVLHELAHVRNRDIDISYLTIAAGRVALPVLLLALPGGISWPLTQREGTGGLVSGAASSLQALSLLVVVPLARRAVLRSREYYADARARQWTTAPDALRALFARDTGRRRLTGTLLRVHPSARQRRAMLDDPAPLFRSGFWELFAVGCVLGALHSDLGGTFLLNSAFGERADMVKEHLAAVLVGLLCAAVVGFLALRADEGFAGSTRTVLWAPSWGLGCGLALGGGVFDGTTAWALATTGQHGVAFLPWTALLCLTAFMAARWATGTVRLWRRGWPRRRRPVLTLCALAAALALLFGGVLFWLMELMVTQALMAALMGRSTPEIVSFVLGAVTHAAVRAPYLVCAATLAAVLSLLGQALVPNPGAHRELRRTVGQGALWGLCLMAVLIHLGLAGVGALGLFVVTGAQIVLAILTGRHHRAEGLAFAHAVLATALAGTLAFTGSETILSLMDCWSGRCSAPDATYATVYLALPAFSALLIASCVPSARRGRRTPGRAPLPGRVPGP